MARRFAVLAIVFLGCCVGIATTSLGIIQARSELATYHDAPRCANSFYRQCRSLRHITITRLHQGSISCLSSRAHVSWHLDRCGDYTLLSYRSPDSTGIETDQVEVATHDIPHEFRPNHRATLELFGTTPEVLRAPDGAVLDTFQSPKRRISVYETYRLWLGVGAVVSLGLLLVRLVWRGGPSRVLRVPPRP